MSRSKNDIRRKRRQHGRVHEIRLFRKFLHREIHKSKFLSSLPLPFICLVWFITSSQTLGTVVKTLTHKVCEHCIISWSTKLLSSRTYSCRFYLMHFILVFKDTVYIKETNYIRPNLNRWISSPFSLHLCKYRFQQIRACLHFSNTMLNVLWRELPTL